MSTINIIEFEKQGIVTILESNFQQNQIPPTLRRTISADMTSRKWLSQNGMSPMRRISSTQELATPSIEVEDDQEEVKQNIPTHDDVWSSILSKKKDNNIETNNQTPPYVHPLLRKSTSNLSQKSLEICTESLGSETGSDGFSSYPHSQTSDDDKDNDKEEKIEQKNVCFEDYKVAKYNYNPSKKLRPWKNSFPPPLPSLHMQSHRNNGRLVLEAVSVPQQKFFHVDRRGGRLLVTLVNNDPQVPKSPNKMEPKVEDFQEVFDNFDEEAIGSKDSQAEEKEDEMGIMIEQKPSSLPNIPMMKSFLGMGKKGSLWCKNIHKVVELMEPEKMGTSLNVYEYFWRRNNKTSVEGAIDSSTLTQQCRWNNIEDYNSDKVVLAKTHSHHQELVIMRGNKGGYFVPLVCQEKRRSLLVWQPHCIATS